MSFIIKAKPLGRDRKPVMVSVGKNVLKKAVDRNLLKRRVRSILRPISKRHKTSFIVVVKPPVLGKAFKEIEREIKSNL